jgi:hypothetical protein
VSAPNTNTAPTTKKTWRVSLTVQAADGSVRDCGVWDASTGGGVGGSVNKHLPGGMGPMVSLPGGTPQIDTITLTRNYDRLRDHSSGLAAFLHSRAAKGRCVVRKRPLDPDGNGWGDSIVWTGTLSKVSSPDTDGNSDESSNFELQVEPDGPVTFA